MARQARGEVIDPFEVQIVHCVHRCVRGAFLCGLDLGSGRTFEHRRQWIRDRMEFLTSVFGIDCLTFSVMDNHVHVILRSRPDVTSTWSDREVARRWLRLFPKRNTHGEKSIVAQEAEIEALANDKERIRKLRTRLSDISWWMRCFAHDISVRSNREDGVKGHFWQGRFTSQVLLDEASLVACAAYVDLNPIRAAMAATPETSLFTGVKDRIDDVLEKPSQRGIQWHEWERDRDRRRSGWLSPVEINETHDLSGPDICPFGRRPSKKGFLSISLCDYLQLLDWTGREIRREKRGAIPKHLISILERLGLDSSSWCNLATKFGKLFRRVAGNAESMKAEAARRGQRWLHGTGLMQGSISLRAQS